MSQDQRLKELTEKVNAAKEAKIKAEARMDELQRREADVLSRLQAKGLDPNRLQEQRDEKQAELDRLLSEAEAILSGGQVPAEAPKVEVVTGAAVASPNSNDVPW